MLNNVKYQGSFQTLIKSYLPLTQLKHNKEIISTMKTKALIALLFITIVSITGLMGQNSTFKTLLPESVVDIIIGEASGERALTHIIEMGAYNHNRPNAEYEGNFFETDYVIGELNKIGVDEVVINRYDGGSSWDGISGELWEVSPGISKLADYGDLTSMLAQGSTNTNVRAKLVWVGEGTEDEIIKANVKGRIAVSSGSPGVVHRNAVKEGAIGIISLNSPRPLKVNLAIPITGISGRGSGSGNATFGFMLPPREGDLLMKRLRRGEEIEVHAVVEAQTLNYSLQVPSCLIKGTDSSAEEIILSAHLFEGYVKQGANDNISGSAALLEVARMLQSMIDEGTIDRPKRGIRFIWVPEFSGTIPYVKDKKDQMTRTLCNINLDMVGINLSDSQSFLCLQRTTYGNAHYINDVMENYYDFVGITNREGLAISGRGGFTKRIVSPSGTDDPFYYSVDDHYGASDHEVFNDPAIGVPGVMMITWPDLYYHTSQDRADKCDPTQLKRVCVITAAAAYTIANADADMALRIGGEIVGNSGERIGSQLLRANNMLDASDKTSFEKDWILGYRYIVASIINEKATLKSVAELGLKDTAGFIFNMENSIDELGKSIIKSYEYFAAQKAKSLGLGKPSYELGNIEKEAAKIVPSRTKKLNDSEYGASRGIMMEDQDLVKKYPVKGRVDVSEIIRLTNGVNTALDIKILLDGQMKSGETDLGSVVNTIKILTELGYFKTK